jgi:two-component sensor histidine kinase
MQLRQRLMALSRAHDYVRPHSRTSRPEITETHLFAMLSEVFAPYRDNEENRIELEGATVPIDDRAATPFALVFHELATNAAKYGALSQPGGRVKLIGDNPDGVYRLTWIETGGPGIAGAPETEGFGTTLARLSVEGQLGGTITRRWDESGLVVDIAVPAASLRRSA